ncbi:MAG: hypothetical protein KDD69_19035 [Bdellovibrionales bacterium]|nr:hypothetical protein [Bdellovibrionales bacterium]
MDPITQTDPFTVEQVVRTVLSLLAVGALAAVSLRLTLPRLAGGVRNASSAAKVLRLLHTIRFSAHAALVVIEDAAGGQTVFSVDSNGVRYQGAIRGTSFVPALTEKSFAVQGSGASQSALERRSMYESTPFPSIPDFGGGAPKADPPMAVPGGQRPQSRLSLLRRTSVDPSKHHDGNDDGSPLRR